MNCPSCHADNREGRRFCRECGGALSTACAACGFFNEPGEAFCGGCGLSVGAKGAAPGERRPVTVLFADLSGYTRLSSTLDPEDVHHLLEKFFAGADGAIAELGGTIDKHIGDNVMALFGAPTAHDNDPERAVRAALEIHARAEALSSEVGFPVTVHIGIASGEVVASGLGSRHHQAYTVVGDAANLAARLQDKAGARETVVSDAVYRATRHLALYEPVGDVEVRGLAAPVRIWKLSRLESGAEGTGPALVGRQAELATLIGLLDDVRGRGSGAVLGVRGEPGIGKSRLTAELVALAEARGFVVHRAAALDFGAAAERDPIRTLAQKLGRVAPAQGPFARDLMGLAPLPEDAQLLTQMDHAARTLARNAALGELLAAATSSQPTLVVVEDVHFADASTIATLTALARTLASLPAIVVFTSRLDRDPFGADLAAAISPTPVVALELRPLADADAQALASAMLGGDAAGARCVERAGGNPLFLLQLLENVREGAGDKLPPTLQSLVMARADRLPEADRTALLAASVLGQRLDLSALRWVLGDEAFTPTALVAHELLERDGDELCFQHALIREGVYSSLTRARRRALHAKAAECFRGSDARAHAEHLERAEDDRAAQAYLAAARGEAAAFQFERAFALLDSGLGLAQRPSDRADLAMFCGELALEVGDARRAEGMYELAKTSASDDLERCRALIGLGAAHRRVSEHERGLAELDAAEDIATRLDLALELAQIHCFRGNLLFALSRREACLAEHALALAQAERAASPLWRARATSGIADAEYALGNTAGATVRFRECVALCDAHGFERIALPNRLMLCFSDIFEGRLRSVHVAAEQVLGAALRLGDRHSEMFARHLVSVAWVLRGDAGRGREPAEHALEMSRALQARRFEAEFLGVLAEVHVGLGDRDAARALVGPALAIARQTGLGYVGPWLLALAAFLEPDPEVQQRHLAEGESVLAGDAQFYNHFFFRRWAIELGLAKNDFDQVEAHAHALAGLACERPLEICRVFAERGLVWAAYGRGDRSATLRARVRALSDALERLGAVHSLPEP